MAAAPIVLDLLVFPTKTSSVQICPLPTIKLYEKKRKEKKTLDGSEGWLHMVSLASMSATQTYGHEGGMP